MAALSTLLTNILKSEHGISACDESESRNLLPRIWDGYGILDVFKYGIEIYQKVKRCDVLQLLGDLVLRAPNSWVEELQNGKNSDHKRKVNTVFESLFQIARVPVFTKREHHIFEKSDFSDIPQRCIIILRIVTFMIEKSKDHCENSAISDGFQSFLKLILPHLLLLVIEHLEPNLWTSDLSCESANKLLNDFMMCFSVTNVDQLLQVDLNAHSDNDIQSPKSTTVSKILQLMTPKLVRDRWKYNPGLKVVYVYILLHTGFPNLSEHLDSFLPPSLLFVDDYMKENKILGIKCLHHIMENVSDEELRWYGRADVIFEALKHQLYIHESPVVEACHPAILAILKVVEKPPSQNLSDSVRCVGKHDDVFQMILQDAECEVNISLRRAYTKHLEKFVERMEITVVKHSKRLLRIITNYLEVYDGPEEISRLNILKTLESFIKVAWPRIECHLQAIVKSLLKFLYDVAADQTTTPQVTKDELVNRAKNCLILLKFSIRFNLNDILPSVDGTDLPEIFKQTVNEVMNVVKE